MRKRKYAKGKRARAICDRGGHEIPYRRLTIEPGTGLRVDKRWSDGRYNAVDHPQNFPPRNLIDEAPLRYPTREILPTSTVDSVITSIVLPNGATIIVQQPVAATTCVPVLDYGGVVLMTEASVTLVDCFSNIAYNSLRYIG